MRIKQLLSFLLLASILLASLGCAFDPPPTAERKPTPSPTAIAAPSAAPTATSTIEGAPLPSKSSESPVSAAAATDTRSKVLAPTATPLPTLPPGQEIVSLKWVSDGLISSEIPLVEQLEIASETSDRYFLALINTPWVRQKRGTQVWGDALVTLNRLAAVDENAAIRVIDLELRETVDNSDAAAIEFLLSLAALDPDGVSRLLNDTTVEEAAREGADGFLPVLYLDVHHPDAASLLRAQSWVQDGIEHKDGSFIAELAKLSLASPHTFRTVLREERDWLPPGRSANAFPDTLRLIGSIGAVDEDAAHRIIDLLPRGRMERQDYYALERLAALADSSPQRLPEILEHPAVAAGNEALVSTVVMLLDLRLRDPEVSAALEGMPWVKEGIGEYMAGPAGIDTEALLQDAADIFQLLLLLEHDAPLGRDLFLTAAKKRWMQDGMLDHEREVVAELMSGIRANREGAQHNVSGHSLDAIAELHWVQSESELYDAARVFYLVQLGALEDDRAFRAVIDRHWVQDGLSESEELLIEHISHTFSSSWSMWVTLWRIKDIGDYELGAQLALLYLEQYASESEAAIAALPWVLDGIDQSPVYPGELDAVTFLLSISGDIGHHSGETSYMWHGSQVLPDLLNRSWVRDEINERELTMLTFLSDLPTDLALSLLPMPFLDSVEPPESEMLMDLGFPNVLNPAALERVLDLPEYAGGLTDENFLEAMEELRRLLAQ